jgi:hypothetical protein
MDFALAEVEIDVAQRLHAGEVLRNAGKFKDLGRRVNFAAGDQDVAHGLRNSSENAV